MIQRPLAPPRRKRVVVAARNHGEPPKPRTVRVTHYAGWPDVHLGIGAVDQRRHARAAVALTAVQAREVAAALSAAADAVERGSTGADDPDVERAERLLARHRDLLEGDK